jgi:hypothetical protein
MTTNKTGLITVEQFMADYQPIYSPLYPLFMGKSRSYSETVGKLDFRRVEAVGDIRAKHLLPKDSEISQIAVRDAKKSFKKYFLANQFTMSMLQDQEGIEDVKSQVLDEHQKQADDLFLLGEGTSASNMLNNGLFWSDDSNYVSESSTEVANDNSWLPSLHSKVLTTATKADRVSGRKVIIFYGTNILPLFDGVYASSSVPFKSVLGQVLGTNYSMVKMPADVTPSNANGWIIANLDQVMLHYTTLPKLQKQGSNEEKEYYWFNFLMGSMMLEVLASGGIIKQPATLEAP